MAWFTLIRAGAGVPASPRPLPLRRIWGSRPAARSNGLGCFRAWLARVRFLNVPSLLLVALLQRVPVLKVVFQDAACFLERPTGDVFKTVVASAAALGAVQTMAGATTFVPTTPSPASATVGSAASFAFAITGTPSSPKSWKVGGTVPPGLLFYTTSTGTTGGVASGTINTTNLYLHGTPTTAGSYTVTLQAWEKAGATSNSTAVFNYIINVSGPAATAPTITTQPQNLTVTAGNAASFTVAASGTAPLTYQWKKDGGALSGATGATYSITSAVSGDAGSYTVVVSNSAGSATSSAATLTVNTPAVLPTITGQPQSVSVTAGGTVSLSVTATGTAPLTYQWKKDGAALSGATSATFSIASAQSTDAGSYTVVVSNSAGSTTSSAATVTIVARVTAPTITAQPQSAVVTAGGSVTFSVTASGTSPSYQWSKDGTALPGATASSYSLASVQAGDAGSYTVVVSNSAGSVTSSAATLTVSASGGGTGGSGGGTGTSAPSITAQPQGVSVTVGTSVVLSVGASGTALAYQWSKDGAAIAGATGSSYSIGSAQTTDSGSYTVVVSNASGSVTSNPATVTVSKPASGGVSDDEPESDADLANISTRGLVGTGDQILIAGFIINGSTPKKVLIRASGPALRAFNVSGVLGDPVLTVFTGSTQIAQNDDWSSALSADFAATSAFAWEAGSKDAALVLTLAPGAYTAQVSGKNGTTGVALVEVYEEK